MQNAHISMAVMAACVSLPAVAGIAEAVHGPVQVPFSSVADIRFVSRSAGWVGELSLLTDGGPTFLMANSSTDSTTRKALGTFSAGDSLFFQYEVTTGGGAGNIYLQDTVAGSLQFKHEFIGPNLARLYVEDKPLPGGDRDYNDAIFEIAFTGPLIPTPGTAVLAGLGGLALLQRRRR